MLLCDGIICPAQFRNLRNLEIAQRILGIPKLRANLEIVQTILRLRNMFGNLKIAQTYVLCNLRTFDLSHVVELRNLEIGTQFRDSENALRNLEIARNISTIITICNFVEATCTS